MESESSTVLKNYLGRMLRAAKLDASLYEEVEADRSAMTQALGVVLFSSLAAGIGTIGHFGGYQHVLSGMFWAIVGWFIWALLTYWIGTRILPGPATQADLGQLLRTIGFAATPGLIRVLGILPGLMVIATMIAYVWMLIAMVVAVRQALDYESTGRAIAVCIIGWLVQSIVILIAVGVAS